MILWLMLLAGFVLLLVGGEILVRGSVSAAAKLGVSPLLIGLTLVGFGTSMPEMVTSVQATYAGSPGIAVGNLVGSNISNILLILGLSALVMPVFVGRETIKRDGMSVLAASVLFAAVSLTVPFGKIIGVMFLVLLAIYLTAVWMQERNEAVSQIAAGEMEALDASWASVGVSVLLAVTGMAIVIGGGYLLVEGAIGIARTYKVPEEIIGLTVVAIGTSMPELATSLIAAIRGHADVAVGNILGSNMFNILAIGGVTATLAPEPIIVTPHIANIDNFVMIAATLALLAMGWFGRNITRLEGGLMFAAFCVYIYVLIAPQIDSFRAATAS